MIKTDPVSATKPEPSMAKKSRFERLIQIRNANFRIAGLESSAENLRRQATAVEDADKAFSAKYGLNYKKSDMTPEDRELLETLTRIEIKEAEYAMETVSPTEGEHAATVKLAQTAIDKSRASINDINKLTEAVIDAKKALELSVAVWKDDQVQFMESSTKMLTDFRQTRMAMDGEITKIKTGVTDILGMLGSPDFAAKLESLNALISAAEKLKALKESGFLDAIVDTLLKADGLNIKNT